MSTALSPAALLMRDRDSIAAAVTDALYRKHPDLMDRHGARGREKCLQDMRYNLDHLIPAVDLEDRTMFARYTLWLDELLRARGISTRDVVSCLERTREECGRRYGGADADMIGVIIGAGLAAIEQR